jgi:uncharacterized protein (DUF2267 family)
MALNFEKYAQEGNTFIKMLAGNLGHPEETGRTGIILRAVMHTLRDLLSFGESLNMISQLPMFLKGLYVDGWEYREKPADIRSKEDFYKEVERYQDQYGEQKFDWDKSTADIVHGVLSSLRKYISEGEMQDISVQMPKAIKELFREPVHH